jgi:hypothetical protein
VKDNTHDMMAMESAVTGPQMMAMTVLTLFFLAAGVFIGALCGDLSMRPNPEHLNTQMLAQPPRP